MKNLRNIPACFLLLRDCRQKADDELPILFHLVYNILFGFSKKNYIKAGIFEKKENEIINAN